MNPRERGFLLLSSRLGDPERRPLTTAQLRRLASVSRELEGVEEDRELSERDLLSLGYDRDSAGHILALLSEEERLEAYIKSGIRQGCTPITRVSPGYPLLLRQRLGLDSPGCLWARGDISILNTPAISLVGSRDLREENRKFAAAVGYEAARQGITLVSGNARGADRTAQDACLQAGGRVISIVSDELCRQPVRPGLLCLSEDGFSEPFSKARALSRNRCIHALGQMVFVAQSNLNRGGSWDGTVKNLRASWSLVACFRDGSESACQLAGMGAYLVDREDLKDLSGFGQTNITFF